MDLVFLVLDSEGTPKNSPFDLLFLVLLSGEEIDAR